MSSLHCVVVWEWQSGAGWWVPHGPSVARQLERAHVKRLTRVVLADADPDLEGHYVNLRTLTQTIDTTEGDVSECGVRRSCYSVQSPAGRGARWEWARAHRTRGQYDPLPMDVQCRLEEALTSGSEGVMWEGWALQVGCMRALAAGAEPRVLRRVPQPPYPLARSPAPPLPSLPPRPSAPVRPSSGSAPSGDRRPGLARQILHNLNIFGNGNKCSPTAGDNRDEPAPEPEGAEETESGSRRHSVDTVSTYLSHESKDAPPTVGDLLDCSDEATLPRHRLLHLECGVCGLTLGGEGRAGSGPAPQPAGSMAWSLQRRPLPRHPPHTDTIQLTYNFSSGTQSAGHPSPGARYYAVGFPRRSLLPHTALGLRVLSLLRLAWDRRLLFVIARSQTTGREHVVAWHPALSPPPSSRRQYAALPVPDLALQACADGLQRLLA